MAAARRYTEKSVGEWFSGMDFDKQRSVLSALGEAHDRLKKEKINALQRQLAELEGGSVVSVGRKATNGVGRGNGKVKVKFRDPKTGDTWSGRGRMAGWLAAKVKGGEKADKYLA
jgi:DNA-binding protein H-NS